MGGKGDSEAGLSILPLGLCNLIQTTVSNLLNPPLFST